MERAGRAITFFWWIISLSMLSQNAYAMTPSRQEMTLAHRWTQTVFGGETPPFSFVYAGKSSTKWLRTWPIHRESTRLDSQRTRLVLTCTDPVTHLQARCVVTEFTDFPAVEWVVYFQNNGRRDTPILERIHSADFRIADNGGDFRIHYANGSLAEITDFEPHTERLKVGRTLSLAPYGGRSSNGVAPFFNIVRPKGGVITAVGWSGQWAASFYRESAHSVIYRAGMQLTHLILHPGERIRTPSSLTLFYLGNPLRGQNLLRSLLLRHYTPRPGGRPINLPIAASGATIGFNNVTAANQIQAIHNIVQKRLPVNTWWIDAGWSEGGFPLGMGTWTPDPVRFPNGLKPVADAAHKVGMRFLLWFEPERVMPGTWLRLHHPAWLLAPADLPPKLAYQHDWRLLNLGDPQALAWAERTFSGMIHTVGIDIYRQDFNMDPLYYWRSHDAPDREGITEIRYIEGLYKYLDYLLHHNPDLEIDDSASGGRRIDIEWLRRCVPLLRTDYLWDPVGAQSMTYGLSLWLPLTGQGSVSTDPYTFYSGMGSCAVYAFDFYSLNADFWKPLSRLIEEYKRVRLLFRGDFYPLTAYSVASNVWIAWQYNRPRLGQGLVQVFRRADSPVTSVRYPLHGLNPAGRYMVTEAGQDTSREMSGRLLMQKGLEITLTGRPGAALITYRLEPK